MSVLSQSKIDELAGHLHRARSHAEPIDRITDRCPDLSTEDAYRIQNALCEIDTGAGRRVVGLKMGLTSRAKMKQVNVDEPIRGVLVEGMEVPDGAAIESSGLIHPRVEPEIAFVTARELAGPGLTVDDVLDATDFVIGALEVIDSRYQGFGFDLPSVIADNCSCARFVVGSQPLPPRRHDLRTIGVVLRKNGQLVATGAGAAVLGHPAASVAMLAAMLDRVGATIPPGTFVLTGGLTAAVPMEPGDTVSAQVQHLGTVSCSFI